MRAELPESKNEVGNGSASVMVRQTAPSIAGLCVRVSVGGGDEGCISMAARGLVEERSSSNRRRHRWEERTDGAWTSKIGF